MVMMGERPARASQKVVDEIRSCCDAKGVLETEDLFDGFVCGQKVRIVDGPLSGHIGVYAGMNAQQREIVLMHLLGRETKVELSVGLLVAA